MKGQGLPITVIIVAALGLLVLVVIAAIFSGQVEKFGREANKCPGTCISKATVQNNPDATCNDFQRKLSGTYIDKDASTKAPITDDILCDSCCVNIG